MPDPFSPHNPHPAAPALEGYNSNFAQTLSTAALPLVGRKGGGDLGTGMFDEDEYDSKTLYTEGGDDLFPATPSGAHRFDEEQSVAPSGYAPSRPMFDPRNMPEKEDRGFEVTEETMEEVKSSSNRRKWVALTWLFTWWIPSVFLSKCGGMKRPDVRMAWREKLLIK